MGQSTDGQICYGIPFEEDFEFPWDAEPHEGSFEDWWFQHINGYESWEDASKRGESKGYFTHRKEFEKLHPCHIDTVNYYSGDYPMWILAVPSSCKSNSRGYPNEFVPEELKVTDKERQKLINFCQQYVLTVENADEFPEMDPKWYLTSYLG